MEELPEQANKKQQEIDKLTLELLMNRNQFKKYKKEATFADDNDKFQFDLDLEAYKLDIENAFNELLNNPNSRVHPDVYESFSNFCKSVIYGVQQRKIESTNLFNADEVEEKKINTNQKKIQSFWNSNIILKKET